jgi:capsule polysaccharide export protein KpsC/LpsZ
MKINLKKSELKANIVAFMRSAGYAPFHDSYVRVLGSGGYPRFHVYIDDAGEKYVLNLHLDQKRPSYGQETAHSGDYEGGPVEAEADRIADFLYR